MKGSCFICEAFPASADNLLDTWIPINLFKCLRAIVPTPYTLETKSRSAWSSLTVASSLPGLDQMWSWDLEELVVMTADTLLLSCLFPPPWTWITWQPMCQHKATVSHLTSSECGSCTCRGCDPLAVKSCSLETLDLEHWGSCQAAILNSQCNMTLFRSHWGSLESGWGVFLCVFYSDWNLNPVKVNGNTFFPLSSTGQTRQFWQLSCVIRNLKR